MPSNGSEGEYFYAQWCARCVREPYARDENAKGRCPILTRAQLDRDAPEWIKDDDGANPRCTKFVPLGQRVHKRKRPPEAQGSLL